MELCDQVEALQVGGKPYTPRCGYYFLAPGSTVSLNLVNVIPTKKRGALNNSLLGGGGLKKIDQVEIIHSCLVFYCGGEPTGIPKAV